MEDEILYEEYKDYLEEMVNIGAGNATAALEEILKYKFDMVLPELHVLPPHKSFSEIGESSLPVMCVKMNMIGDVKGEIFFVVPRDEVKHILELARGSIGQVPEKGDIADSSIILEIGNIMTGVYLAAIHDFCKLNIYHSVPIMAEDMVQSLLDETIARLGADAKVIVIIINKFVSMLQSQKEINTYLIMIPYKKSEQVLFNSIKEAKKICGR
jgi:chemotaxis protein CheC